MWFVPIVIVLMALMLSWWLAPRLGNVGFEPRSKGFSAIQTITTVVGVILVAIWYVMERPDAARLKFEQTLSSAPLPDGKALVITEITITNVGVHTAYIENMPFAIYLQQVAPVVDDAIAAESAPNPDTGVPAMRAADNWSLIAYYLGGEDQAVGGKTWRRTGDALTKVEIQAGETDNFYYRATVNCAPALHVSVSSRFRKHAGTWERLQGLGAISWMKQSFLDLTDTCKPKDKP